MSTFVGVQIRTHFDRRCGNAIRDEIRRCCEVLLEAQARSHQQFTNYGTIAFKVGVSARSMGGVLGQVSRESYEKKHILLSVLVGNKRSKFPSAGFFALARELGAMQPNELPQEFYKAELLRVFSVYADGEQ